MAYRPGLPFEGLRFGSTRRIWLANGIVLLVAPRFIIVQVRKLLQQSPEILRWELLAIIGGVLLFFAAQDLPYQWLG